MKRRDVTDRTNEAEETDVGAIASTLYRSKPSEIEAVQWTGYLGDLEHLIDAEKVRFDVDVPGARRGEDGLELLAGKDGAQGWVPVPRGHWIVNNPGDLSDIWPVDPDYFEAKYELAEGV